MNSTLSAAAPALPANAPFTPKQRAWLNGFFAGLVSSGQLGSGHESIAATAVGIPASTGNGSSVAEPATQPTSWKDVAEDDPYQYAWHSSELPLDERMQLAEGQPHDLQLMAAMAQLDCGQCGYLCRTYAKAIETGEETNLKLCAPGGKATSRKLVELQKQRPTPAEPTTPAEPATSQAPSVTVATDSPSSATVAYSRQNPFPADAIHVEKLTGEGSAKDTRLISLSLAGSGLSYKVGDALGVFPKNSKQQVEALIRLLGHEGCEPVRTPDGFSTTLRGALSEYCDLKTPSDDFLELLLKKATRREDTQHLELCLAEQEVPGLIDEPRVIDLVARFREIALSVEEVVAALDSLKPRLYSIASSPKVHPERVDLVVGVVQYVLKGQSRQGVASTFLANRMLSHEPVPVFIQPCHHFGVPDDPATPIIMVGPGTGVAPFRAFLHERRATRSPGDNWLFFGDQHEATDFLLKEELLAMQAEGLLTRLSTAFSRDTAERVYVQHRMLEHRDELWRWLDRGAHFYVCGDAARMAGDVDRALHQVIMQGSGRTAEAATEYVAAMKKTGRYQRDVY